MKTFSRLILGLGALAATVMLASHAQAQATRTWVSGVGDDANPCSRTAPCKTFAGAISKTADRGEINCLDPGGFGAVTITKNITIDCGGTFGSILAAGTNGIIISNVNPAVALDVTIRDISIDGAGTGLNGIRALLSGSLHVENVRIFNFTQKGLDIQPAQGVLFASVVNSTIHLNDDASGGGILVKPGASASAKVSVIGSVLDRNLFGARVEDRGSLAIADSSASGNKNNGLSAISVSDPSQLNASNVLLANNGASGVGTSGGAAVIRLARSSLFGNTTGINTAPSGTVATTSPASNVNAGNTTAGAPNGSFPLQ